MLDGVKKDLQLLRQALDVRLTPQWADPQLLCRFERDASVWEFSYLAPSAQGQSGSLLQLKRNGKFRFEITLRQPESELPQWRDALNDVLTSSAVRDAARAGWWMRLYLRLHGRRIEACRLVMLEETPIGLRSTDVNRYYLARLSGWLLLTQPFVLIANTDTFKTRSSTKISSRSVRLLPEECRKMAGALHRLLEGVEKDHDHAA